MLPDTKGDTGGIARRSATVCPRDRHHNQRQRHPCGDQAGALFGVTVDRAQQRIDVDEGADIGAGQQLDAITQSGQVVAQHRFQLAGVAETELPQQGSDRRGRVHAPEQGLHPTRAHDVEIVDAVRARAHSRDQRGQFRRRVR
jgi:hypothetical protein